MARKYHNRTLPTNTWHREEEKTEHKQSQDTKQVIKVNEPSLSSSARCLETITYTKKRIIKQGQNIPLKQWEQQ